MKAIGVGVGIPFGRSRGWTTLNFIVKVSDVVTPFVKIIIGDDYVITDNDGLASFQLTKGNYSYTAERSGYEPVTDTIEVISGVATVNITMEQIVVNDYFLPSILELAQLSTVKDNPDLSNLNTNEVIWSSSEYNATNASRRNIQASIGGSNSKATAVRTRAIRSFQSTVLYPVNTYTPYGDVVFYIDETTSPHTYYCVLPQQLGANAWSNIATTLIGAAAQGTAIGSGKSNTLAIMAQDGFTGGAAKVCSDVVIKPSRMFYKENMVPIITISFDQEAISMYTGWFSLFQSLGVVGGVAPLMRHINPPHELLIGAVGNMTWEHLREMEMAGWEILSHSMTHVSLSGEHGYDPPTPEVYEYELKDSRDMIRANGLTCNNFTWPWGDNNRAAEEEAMKYYRSSRDFCELTGLQINENGFNLNAIRAVDCDIARDFEIEATVTEIKGYIDDAYTNKAWINLGCHQYNATKGANMAELINYAKSKGFLFMTINEALDYIQ